MNLFRQLRWKLTLSYTLVTVGAFLVVLVIIGWIVLGGIFIPEESLNPEQMIDAWMNSTIDSNYLIWSRILSQSPVDTDLVNLYLNGPESAITSIPLFRIGALEFWVSTQASIRVLILGADGLLLAASVPDDPVFRSAIGRRLDPVQVPGLEAPLNAAMAGDRDPKHLYTVIVPNQQYIAAVPVFNRASGDKNQPVGAMVVLFDAVPTQRDIPAHILAIAGISLIIILLGTGILGTLFGSYFAHGLATRFKQLSTATDGWSEGDFSKYIDDTTGDEISDFAQRLNRMAKQLQSLLRRREDMAVSEERNRLARDLHDSAKQQALAASFELGAALTWYERDPQQARKHLVQADALVDSVRRELTSLVDELRPQSTDGQDFSEVLKEHASDWSHRSGIQLNMNIEGNGQLPFPTRETLFRIAQEALANVARHSSAGRADLSLEYGKNLVNLTIQDDGRGFDPSAPHDGLGLHSMQERAEAMGGGFTVESTPGAGTKIVVTLPKENPRRRNG